MATHPLTRKLSREWSVLAVTLLLFGAVWRFFELADEVRGGDTHQFDEAVPLSMRNLADHADPIGPGWVEEIGRDFTALGAMAVLVLIVLATSGFPLLPGPSLSGNFTRWALPA